MFSIQSNTGYSGVPEVPTAENARYPRILGVPITRNTVLGVLSMILSTPST